MIPRIERLLERAWRSEYVGCPMNLPPTDPADPPVIRMAKEQVAKWQQQPIDLSADEQIAGRAPHVRYGETRVAPQSFGRRSWTIPAGITLEPATEALFHAGYLDYAGNHTTVDYATILTIGFSGLMARIDARLARLTETSPTAQGQNDFLRALRIVADGYIAYCRRHGALAAQHAAECADEVRAAELHAIAEHCSRVVAEPPRSFHEACQALWFAFYFLPDAPGRVDALLAPFYRREMENGTLTREMAKALLSELWIKYFEFLGAAQAVSALQHLTLGGVTAEGEDAAGELTILCLEVTAELRLHRPQIGLRWHAGLSDEVLQAAVRTWRSGAGSPDLCNDEQIIPALTRLDVAIADARNYSLSGCQEVIVSGKAQMGSVEGFINLPKVLRLALGIEPQSSCLSTMPIVDYAMLWSRFEQALAFIVEHAHLASCARDRYAAQDPLLCASLVVDDCIEQARGYTQGGARYNFCNWNIIGLANVTDALMAVKRLVFDDGQLTLDDLCTALSSGWVGWEDLRRRMRQCPAFGNDEDEVDALAAQIVTRLDAHFKRYTPYRGGCYILGTTAGGENMHIEFGRVTGATPDGRREGETLVDSIGAVQGRDRQGVTALLNSVAKLPHALLPTATTLNVKLDPTLLERDAGVAAVASLVRAHFLAGGQHFQANLVDRDTLRDARAHPERHQHLMVRVAGYSAQFISLWHDLQEEIISRTEHAV